IYYYYLAPHAFTDHNADGYFGTYINRDFVALFSNTDVRNLFETPYDATPANWNYYTTTKFTFAFDSDMPLMRTPEMILIEAEAMFKQTREGDAHNLLYELQLNRDPSAVKSSNTGNALYEEILRE